MNVNKRKEKKEKLCYTYFTSLPTKTLRKTSGANTFSLRKSEESKHSLDLIGDTMILFSIFLFIIPPLKD